MRVKMTISIHKDDYGWSNVTEAIAELSGDRQVVAMAGWEGIARRLVKKALNDFGTQDTEEDDPE